MSSKPIYNGPRVTNTETFIRKARLVHSDLYDYSEVVYKKSNESVKIICPTHGEFLQRPNNHLNGTGCSECKLTIFDDESFIKKSIEIHGDGVYDYSLVEYVSARSKVKIICPFHGVFLQPPSKHTSRKQGCPKCTFEDSGAQRRSAKGEFVKKAIEVHGSKYDYSDVNYITAITKVNIRCPAHGVFSQTPNHHISSGHGCPKCKSEKAGDRFRSTTVEFIERAIEVHGDKFDYSLVNYIDNRTKVLIICPDHGEFQQTPDGHLSTKSGCSKCVPTSRYNEEAADIDCCVYFVSFEVGGDLYEKIGITSRSIEARFRYEKIKNLRILYEKWGKYKDCWLTEEFLLEKYSSNRYRTALKGKVHGWTETFPTGVLDRNEIQGVIEDTIN